MIGGGELGIKQRVNEFLGTTFSVVCIVCLM